MTTDSTCPIWNTPAAEHQTTRDGHHMDSPRAGGQYFVSGTAASMLNSLAKPDKVRFTSWLVEQRRLGIACPEVSSDILKQVRQQRLPNVHERADALLRYLAAKSDLLGTVVSFRVPAEPKSSATIHELLAWTASMQESEIVTLAEYCNTQGWVEYRAPRPQNLHEKGQLHELMLRPPGHARLAELDGSSGIKSITVHENKLTPTPPITEAHNLSEFTAMKKPSILEQWSWIAGIATAVIMIGSLILKSEEEQKPLDFSQQGGHTNTQIGSVSGNVIINSSKEYDSASRDEKAQTLLEKRLPNIFVELEPGASVEKMKSILGPPHAQGPAMSGALRIVQGFSEFMGENTPPVETGDPRTQYSYRFDDAYVQIRTPDKETISELMVITRDAKNPAAFKVGRLDVVLGRTKLNALLETGEEVEFDSSAKHRVTFVRRYFGLSGNYLYYTFGNLSTPNTLSPENNVVNWAVITFKKDTPYFDWAHIE